MTSRAHVLMITPMTHPCILTPEELEERQARKDNLAAAEATFRDAKTAIAQHKSAVALAQAQYAAALATAKVGLDRAKSELTAAQCRYAEALASLQDAKDRARQ